MSWQPLARLEYVLYMGGVDVADQRLGAHQHDHKPRTYFWRRVFDQKVAQAISNAYLLYRAWAQGLVTDCAAAVAAYGEEGAGLGAGGGAGGEGGEECDLTMEELVDFGDLLAKSLKMDRVVWDQRLSRHLMALCNVGHVNKGARRDPPVVESYDGAGAKKARVCASGVCPPKSNTRNKYSGARTLGVCWCNVCTGNKGKDRALHLCKKCRNSPPAHFAAAAAADKKKYKPVVWAEK